MNTYRIVGCKLVQYDLDVEVDADTPEEAEEKAIRWMNNLDEHKVIKRAGYISHNKPHIYRVIGREGIIKETAHKAAE